MRFLTLSLLFLAQISFLLDNVTYWLPGSLVKLPWTYNFNDILVLEVSFTIEGQATLVFKNANLGHDGTYSLVITLRGGVPQQRFDVKVLILGEKNLTNLLSIQLN